MSSAEGGARRRASGGSHLERMASLVDYSSSDESDGDAWHPSHDRGTERRPPDPVPPTAAPTTHPPPPFAARSPSPPAPSEASPMDVGSPGMDNRGSRSPGEIETDPLPTTTTIHTTTTHTTTHTTMRFNLGASPSPRHPTRRRSETVRNGPRSPGSGALGASAASRLASRRAANRRAAAVGSEGFAASSFASPNTKFDQTQTTASPKEEATFSGTPESPPPFDFFSPGGVDASGGRRRPGSGAAGFAASPPFSPNLFSPNLFSPNLSSPNPSPLSPNANANANPFSPNASFASDVSSGTPLAPGTFAMGASASSSSNRRTPTGRGKNGGKKNGMGKNGDEGTRARTARTFEFTPPPPPPGSGSSFTPASAGSAPPPATMPDLNFAGFNLGAGSSSDKNKTSFRRNLRSDGTDRRRGGPARSSGPRRARGAPPSSSTKPGGESPGVESPPGESPGGDSPAPGPSSSSPSPSGSPNPADYGADRGPARRARRPARVTVRFFDETAGKRLEKDHRSPVDVLRERTAAMNLRSTGGSTASSQNHAPDTFDARSSFANHPSRGSPSGRAKANVNPEHASGAAREKDEGNEHFRAGRYAAAFASYTRAIEIESTRHDRGSSRGVGTGRDVAVCYANRAATRLMLAAESTAAGGGGVRRGVVGKNVNAFENGDVNKNAAAAAETRLALADCRAALRADPRFDRARLRAGTCLVRLGAFAAAEAEFNLVRSRCPEACELAGEAARARRAVDALRAETLPWLRRRAIRGVAEGAETARRVAVGRNTGQNGHKNGHKNGRTNGSSDVRVAAERTVQVVAPLRRLAPHCAVVAEAHARASLCVGAFAEATRAADEDGFGGAIDETSGLFDEDAVDEAGGVGPDVAGSNPASSKTNKKTTTDGWRRVVRALAHFARGNPGACVDELAGLSASFEKTKDVRDGVRSGDVHDEETASLAALRRVATSQDAHKRAGNDAFRAGRFDDAVARYASAIDAAFQDDVSVKTSKETSPDGTPDDDSYDVGCMGAASVCFAALCLCNSAAAAQGAGDLLDALAYCGGALALNPARGKSTLRRAQVSTSLRLSSDAIGDYRALVRLLEGASGKVSDSSGRVSDSLSDAGAGVDVESHLAAAKAALRELAGNRSDDPPDHYATLGLVPPDVTVADRANRTRRVQQTDVRRAYRALALRHHPDKSLKTFLGSNILGAACGIWPGWDSNRRVDDACPSPHELIRADADRIFKLLGEANARLSDPATRAAYDADEIARANSRAGSSDRTRRGGSGFDPRGGHGGAGSRSSTRGRGGDAGGWRGKGAGREDGHAGRGGDRFNNNFGGGGRGRGGRGGRRWDGFGASYGF